MTDQPIPLILGPDEAFQTVRSFLAQHAFSDATVCRVFDIPAMSDIGLGSRAALDQALDVTPEFRLLARLFLLGEQVERHEWDALPSRAAFEALGLVTATESAADAVTTPVLFYPVAGFWIASDRADQEGDSRFDHAPDVVFPAIFGGTLHLVRLLPSALTGRALDIGAGAGILGFALGRAGARVVASDITERSAFFAEFNRRLNGLNNVTVARGDLYQAVAGEQFDFIVSHPPYVPTLAEEAVIFRDAGVAGEDLLRRIIKGLPGHLRPGGDFFALSAAFDTVTAPLEQRLREWLGEEESGFDILIAPETETPVAAFAARLGRAARVGMAEAMNRWLDHFRRLGAKTHVYGAIAIRRRLPGSPGEPITQRRRLAAGTGAADFAAAFARAEWRRRQEAAGAFEARMAALRPRLAPGMQLEILHKPIDGRLTAVTHTLMTEQPFRSISRVDPGMAALLNQFDGGATVAGALKQAETAGLVPAGLPLSSFIELVWSFGERGYLAYELE